MRNKVGGGMRTLESFFSGAIYEQTSVLSVELSQTKYARIMLKEKKMQSKGMFGVVDDDIESPYTKFPDIFDFCYKIMNVFVSLS